jgi:hypothetical protein
MEATRPTPLSRFRALARAALVSALAFAVVPAHAQSYEGQPMQTLRMDRGVESVSIEGSVEGWEVQKFRIPAERGQTLRLGLEGRNASLAFNLIHPNTGAIVHDGIRAGRRADVLLQSSGDWVVEVFLTRAAADRWDVANFRLDARLAAKPAPQPLPPTASTGTLVVSGLGNYDSLNIRSEASLNARVVATAPNGTRLTNGGCFARGSMNWCAVSDPNGRFAGFASARYLSAGNTGSVQPRPPVSQPEPQPLDVRGMMKACRDLAHEAWNIPPGLIVPSEPVAVGRGFQSSAATVLFGLSGTCTFDGNGIILRFQ